MLADQPPAPLIAHAKPASKPRELRSVSIKHSFPTPHASVTMTVGKGPSWYYNPPKGCSRTAMHLTPYAKKLGFKGAAVWCA